MNTKIQSISFNALWHQIRSRPLVWDTITTTFFSTAGKSVAFLVPFFVAARFGVSEQTDAFFFAYGIIIFLLSIFSPVLEAMVVPYIADLKSQGKDVEKFVGGILSLSGGGLLTLLISLLIVIRPILTILTQFDPQSLHLVFVLLLEISPLIVFVAWTSIISGILNAYKQFQIPSISPAIRGGVALALIFAFKGLLGIHAIAVGYLVGEILRLLILIRSLVVLDLFSLKLNMNYDKAVQNFVRVGSYQALGMLAVSINPFVSKIVASWLTAGSISMLEYAYRLFFVPITFFGTGLFTVSLSHWSSDQYENRFLDLTNVLRVLKMLCVVCILATIILIVLGHTLVSLAYGWGGLSAREITTVKDIFTIYVLGLTPYMMFSLTTRVYILYKETHILMYFFVVSFLINTVLSILFASILGVYGIALATSVTSFLIMLPALLLLRIKAYHEPE